MTVMGYGAMASGAHPRSGLAAFTEAFSGASSTAVSVREVRLACQINLRGNPDDPAFLEEAMGAVGCPLPLGPCTVSSSPGGAKVLWLGPDCWLVVHPDVTAMKSILRRTLAGQHVSITDASSSRLVVELSGPKATRVLEKLCLIDLHPSVFAVGRVVGTVIARTQVFVEKTDPQPTYWLYVLPSFCRHLAAMLVDSMAEFSGGS